MTSWRQWLGPAVAAILVSCSEGDSSKSAESNPDSADEGAPAEPSGDVAPSRGAFEPDPAGQGWMRATTTYEVHAASTGVTFSPTTGDPAGLRIETIAANRDGASILREPSARLAPDGSVEISRGGFTERWEDTDEGVAQSFELEQAPAGMGDLSMRMLLSGGEYVGGNEGGHHFRLPGGGVLRYGSATWVDATGARTALQVHREPDGLGILVPGALLEASVFPAEIDPLVSLGSAIDTSAAGPASGPQQRAAIAFDGVNYLVLWNDTRLLEPGPIRMVGTRVTPAGEVLDVGGFTVFDNQASDFLPAVVFNGTHYLAVLVNSSGTVYGKRITPGGVVLDSGNGKNLGTAAPGTETVGLAAGSNGFLVAWAGTNYTTRGRLLDSDGTPQGATFNVNSDVSGHEDHRIAFDGSNYFVVWCRGAASIRGARVSPAGAVLDAVPLVLSNGEDPTIAFDGTQYLVAWTHDTSQNIQGKRVTPAGALLDATPLVLSGGSGNERSPDVAFDGQNFVVAFHGTNDIYTNRVNGAGQRVDGTGIVVSAAEGLQDAPAVACGTGSCFAAWESNVTTDIFGRGLQTGTVTNPTDVLLSVAAAEQTAPIVAFGGGVYFAAWEERRGNLDWDIYGALLDTSGRVLGSGSFPIVQAARDQLEPRIAVSNGMFLVAWSDHRFRPTSTSTRTDVFAARVSLGGTVLDPNGFPLTTETYDDADVVVASDGTDFLAVWRDGVTVSPQKLEGVRIGSNGVVQNANPFPIATGLPSIFTPSLTYGAGEYFLVWGVGVQPYGARILPNGTVLDPGGFTIGAGDLPAVAFDGTQFVVVTRKSVAPPYDREIRAHRVSTSGSVLDPNGIAVSPPYPSTSPATTFYRNGPQIAFDGVDSAITWGEDMSSEKLSGVWFSPAGTVVATRHDLSGGPNVNWSPAIASEGDGDHELLVYIYGDDTPGVRTRLAHAAIVTAKTNGSACSLSHDCKTHNCIDRVCCDTPCGGGVMTDCLACSVAAGASVDGVCGGVPAACNDGNQCTLSDSCAGGTCAGTPVVCTALDACHVPGVCQPATGACTNPVAANGSACSDNDACTTGDSCQQGQCTGAPTTCGPPGDCEEAGVCDPASGGCVFQQKADGAPCSDDDGCTVGDLCFSGTCAPGPSLVCPAAGQCEAQGICDPATGQCDYAPLAAGTPCDDGLACTSDDACANGACTGEPLVCVPLDACHQAGSCDPQTGACSNPSAPDGTPCPGGTCTAGTCVPDGNGGATGTAGMTGEGGLAQGGGGEGGLGTGGLDGGGGEGGFATGGGGTGGVGTGGVGTGGVGTGATDSSGGSSGEGNSNPTGDGSDDGSQSPDDGCSCATSTGSNRDNYLFLWIGAALLGLRLRRSGRSHP